LRFPQEERVSDPARRLLSTISLAVGLIALAEVTVTPAAAQVLYGSIVGNVTDSQGAAVPGAAVTIVNKETNLTREATTNAEGNYNLVNVLPGRYDVKISLSGFREVLRANVPVTIGQLSRVDAALEVGALTETVTVQSQAELLQTDSAEVNTQLKSTEITAMPLNRFRNYQALVNLAPGTNTMSFQNAETDTPARSLATNVNGQAINSNATRTDGATNVNIWLPSHNMYVSPAETIDTVNVSTNNFDAEQGMAGGSAITVITKSGTNSIRGSAFEFFNNDSLNARPYYFGTAAPTLEDGKPPKLPVERNIFGGTVGGPIKRDKLFYFGSYEGYRSNQSLFTFFNVPDEALRNGDFTRALNANGSMQTIYDPATGNPDGTGRVPFAGNVIPANRINPIARQILQQLAPLPNRSGIGAGGYTENYQRQETRTTDRDNYDVKVNWNRTSAHQVWWKFSYMDAVVDDLTNYLGPDPDASGDGGLTKVWQLTTGHTWTLGPTMIMDGTFGFSRQDQDVLGPDFQAGFYGLDTLGIPGTNDPLSHDPRYAGYPRFDIGTTGAPGTAGGATGFSILGNRDGWNPIFRDERTYSFATNLTKLAGAHEFRGGYMGNFLYLDHWQPESDNPRGRFDFTTRNTTALRGGAQTANFYNFYAAFLLGLPGTVSKSVQNELMTGREWQHGLFFRDRWTVSPKLTLDLGIRWEYYPIMHRADRGLERVDLDTLEVILGGVGGNPDSVGLSAGKDNFAPRLGAIYRLNEDTVIRGGYGVTYNPVPWARALRGDNAYPITLPVSFFNTDTFQPYGNLSQGIPIVAGPAPSSTGRVPLPNSVTVWTAEPGNVDRGTIQTWNVAFERRLPWDISADIAYVGARGDGGYGAIDINQPVTVGSGDAGRRYFSRGRVTQLLSFGQNLETRYHSMQLAVNRPFTHGLMLKGAYTLSKAENEGDQDGRQTLIWNHPTQLDRNFALAGFDRTHNLQLGFLYQLPWQSATGYNNIGKAIVSDWQLNGVFGAWSGTPFTVVGNGAVVNTPNNQQTADLVGEIRKTGNIGSAGTYYDPTAWAQPQGVRFGNTGRNSVRGPGAWNVDLGVFRAFPMGASRRLELRLDAINVTNTAKFANPNNDVNSGSFMRITDLANSNGVPHYPMREIRVGLRFSF
jgi:hypothetical protein